jgi:dihydroorotate dehydrogenase
MYKLLFYALTRLPAETAHRLAFGLIRRVTALPGVSSLLDRWLTPADPALRVRVFGKDLPGPFGLAAGFDKDAIGPDALGAMGFTFVEIGPVTARPQPGNPKPRMFRLPRDRALINRMGFNNLGAEAAAARLKSRRERNLMVGANIGKTKTVPEPEAAGDYAASARLLAGTADYLVINVSSPNTPGLRDLQAVTELRPLVTAVRQALGTVSMPLLIKIAPDLADADIDAIADLALELGLDGIIATNTTTTREHLATDPAVVREAGSGGLSGQPLKDQSLHVLRRLRTRTGDRLVLIAVGGIETPDDAWERIQAGATLLQAYTGFVYGGPLWPRRIHHGLARHTRLAGFTSIQQAVGTAMPRTR